MKYIELKKTEASDGLVPMDYASVIRNIASTPPVGGATIEVQRRQIRILDALEAAEDGDMKLEDADHQLLCRLIEGYSGWAVVNKAIIQFADHVKSAPDFNERALAAE